MEVNKIYHGNCMDLFKELPNESIDSVITSPPYWQLRDYKWDGQWGLEPTFQEYLEHLWQMMDESWRVLKNAGTIWVNLGDTYGTRSNNMVSGNIIENKIKYTGGIDNYNKPDGYSKCLLLIPHRFAIGCIDRGWIVRNDIIWAKRNGMPESVTDRFTKKHEYFFLMVKNEKYYFDLDGVKGKLSKVSIQRYNYGWNGNTDRDFIKGPQSNMNKHFGDPEKKKKAIEGGKNPGDVADFWDIPTRASGEDHYAAYNTRLIHKPIVAGSPEGGIILDPFCGTATTGCRAIELKRKFIGFEGREDYVKVGNRKIEKFIKQQPLF